MSLQLVPEDRVLLPPKKFGVVERSLFRSSMPQGDNLTFLQNLALKSLIVLSAQKPHLNVLHYLIKNNIVLHHVGAEELTPPESSMPVSHSAIRRSLELVLNPIHLPALVCDFSGLHEVCIFVGVLRRLQNWNLNSALDEYRAFAYQSTRFLNEQYIELFDINSINIPKSTPQWFSVPQRMHDKEEKRLHVLHDVGALDRDGVLSDTQGVPKFKVYFFSTNAPLNSSQGAKPPRIQYHKNAKQP